MKPHRRNRLILVCLVVVASGAAVGMAMMALNENINLFYSPEQIVQGEAPIGQRIRAGGMVMDGSVQRAEEDLTVRFRISDTREAEVPVEYVGILPDLFREGQGVIALGTLGRNGVFKADEVLAKHDENYMPPELEKMMAETHTGDGGGQ
ncbi:MAG: cytochrome c maturation protein CcmE [Pseudomonadales bacterium]